MRHYKGDRYLVNFSFLDEDTCDGNAYLINYQSDDDLSESEAVKIGESLAPVDATFIREYALDAETTVRVYESKSLRTRFRAGDWYWTDGKPGVFTVFYSRYNGLGGEERIDGVTVATGNDP